MNYPQARRSVSLSARISPRFAPAPLRELENWQVQRHLGEGSSAQVWLLEHRISRQRLACKSPQGAEDVLSLSQEAKLAQALAHENLVRCIDGAQVHGLAPAQHAGYTFWEFLPAGSLETLIGATGALSIAQTVTVLLPMIQVAEYLHSQQIIHGDFSPANILFDLTGRPVLIDLGAVRATAHAFHTTGTPGFIAPEINDAGASMTDLGAAADVYSLAAIGWFCLAAASPGPPHARLPLVMLQPDLDAEIIDVLEACLTAEPALRPSLSQLLDAVAHWSVPEPVDLFASVGEEYELLLPTRKPTDHRQSSDRPTRRLRRKPAAFSSNANSTAEIGLKRRPEGLRRRVLLGLGTCGLLAAAIATNVYVGQSSVPEGVIEEVPTRTSYDFQAVVDELARKRGQAWAAADSSQVVDYALEDSKIFENDVRGLAQLQEAGTVLEGIRMRAVVELVRSIQKETIVEVEWRIDGYVQRDEAGQVVETVAARTEQLVLVLTETAHGWRLRSVEQL